MLRRMIRGLVFYFVILVGFLSVKPTAAMSEMDFYKGRSINLIIGLSAGGGYDLYGRLIARHMSRYIPGNPPIVAQNLTGAGSVIAANALYNTSPKDGTVFGTVAASALMLPLLGNKQALFDPTKFSWLGSATKNVAFCGVHKLGNVQNFRQLLDGGRELLVGASGPAALTYQHAIALKNVLGANVQIVSGYKGTPQIRLALEGGEVHGICGLGVSAIQAEYQQLVDRGEMSLLIQMGPFKDTTFGNIESVYDYARTEEQRQILSVIFDPLALGRPFLAPPGVQKAQFDALNEGFKRVLRDAALLAEARKMDLNIDYVSGDEAREMLQRFSGYPQDLLNKATVAIGQ